ncbi:MAG TPA: hypothetical protein VMN60_12610 [Longimicrobiales bacterium]|nr:hypothetical protein [Longimicrobiales bacterium]
MKKKPYTPPTVTEHGNAVKQTRGLGGEFWEIVMPKPEPDIEDPPKD